jgi:serine/threonine-protein kinase ULK4
MKEKNEKVKRRAIAALGEYMFYAATQLDDDQVDPVWELSNDAITVIVRSLRMDADGDEVVRFYSCKTLENICAQSNSAGHKFTTLETINHLLAIFLHQEPKTTQARAEARIGLQTSAAVALSHIVRLNSQLFPIIFERITAVNYCLTLSEGPPRVQ